MPLIRRCVSWLSQQTRTGITPEKGGCGNLLTTQINTSGAKTALSYAPETTVREAINQPTLHPLVSWRQLLLFGLSWLVIGGVSAIDTYLTVRDQESLFYLELNPVARWLLEWDNWSPATLVGLKFLGSMTVLGLLAAGFYRQPRRTLVIAGSLAILQSALLLFLAGA